jgi:hypothetical protein
MDSIQRTTSDYAESIRAIKQAILQKTKSEDERLFT